MSNRLFLLLMLLLPLLGACVKPLRQITSFRDPAYRDIMFRRVAVFVEADDLQWRHDLESKMAEKLRLQNVDAVAGHTILVPTRVWSDSARAGELAGNGFDAYLHLSVDAVETWESLIPAISSTYVQKEVAGYVRGDAKAAPYTETVTAHTETPYVMKNTRIRYIIRLVDIPEGETAWIGLNEMYGYSKGRIPRFCEETAAQLLRDTVLLASLSPP